MQKTLSILFGITLSMISYAQDTTGWNLYKPANVNATLEKADERVELRAGTISDKKGEVRYIQDERITILDEYLKAHPIRHEGYRVQLVFGSRGEVASARSMFLSRWDYSHYEDYLPPNFRLRVGDFMTRIQAEKALKDLKGRFPNAYLVRDKIQIPREYR